MAKLHGMPVHHTRLPDKLRCNLCERTKNLDRYTRTQQEKAKRAISFGLDIDKVATCDTCGEKHIDEFKCNDCDKVKGRGEFSHAAIKRALEASKYLEDSDDDEPVRPVCMECAFRDRTSARPNPDVNEGYDSDDSGVILSDDSEAGIALSGDENISSSRNAATDTTRFISQPTHGRSTMSSSSNTGTTQSSGSGRNFNPNAYGKPSAGSSKYSGSGVSATASTKTSMSAHSATGTRFSKTGWAKPGNPKTGFVPDHPDAYRRDDDDEYDPNEVHEVEDL